MRSAFQKLFNVLPIHPKDTKSKKLNRIQILKRAIKYIHCMKLVLASSGGGVVCFQKHGLEKNIKNKHEVV